MARMSPLEVIVRWEGRPPTEIGSAVILRRNTVNARHVERILQLPDDKWSDVKMHFGLDDVAYAEVTFILKPEQLVELAALAAYPPPKTEVQDNDQSDSDRGLDHPQRLEADDA